MTQPDFAVFVPEGTSADEGAIKQMGFDAVVNDLFEAMDLMAERSTLPEKPDEAGIDRLMCSIRRSMCP